LCTGIDLDSTPLDKELVMSNYVEDYRHSSYEEKIWMLQQIYKTATKEQKEIIVKEVQKLYNQHRGR